jgi:hypothetical protein
MYRVKKRCTSKPSEGESAPQKIKKKSLMNTGLLKYGSWLLKKCWAYSPWASMQAWKEKTNGTLLSSTSSDWGCLPRFLKKGLSRAVTRCGSADLGFLHDHDDAPPHLLLTNFNLVLAVWEFFNSMSPEKWIGQREPAAWLAGYH